VPPKVACIAHTQKVSVKDVERNGVGELPPLLLGDRQEAQAVQRLATNTKRDARRRGDRLDSLTKGQVHHQHERGHPQRWEAWDLRGERIQKWDTHGNTPRRDTAQCGREAGTRYRDLSLIRAARLLEALV